MLPHAIDVFDDRRARLADGRFFLLTGFPKSGTTWVHTILDAHPAVLCRGEDDLNALARVIAPALEEYNQHSQSRNASLPKDNHARFGERDLEVMIAAAAVVLWGKEAGNDVLRVGAKMNDLAMNNTEALCDMFGPLSIVHVLRDVRDVIVSGYFNNLRTNREQTLARWPTLADMVRDAVPMWRNSLATLRAVAAKDHVHMLEIRYEQLLAEPAAEVARLFAFLDVDASADLVARIVDETRFDRMAGGRQAGDEASGQFMRKGVAGDWREKFDDACHAACAEFGVEALMREAGYPAEEAAS